MLPVATVTDYKFVMAAKHSLGTGQLKLKYPTRQNAISQQPCEICLPNFFPPDKTKVNAKHYVETLLPEPVQDCRSILPCDFILHQDGTPAHMAKLA